MCPKFAVQEGQQLQLGSSQFELKRDDSMARACRAKGLAAITGVYGNLRPGRSRKGKSQPFAGAKLSLQGLQLNLQQRFFAC